MHKLEASELFLLLGNPDRVKIVKFLYNSDVIYSLEMINNLVDCNQEELINHLNLLLDKEILIKKENGYICNKSKVYELMNFVLTPCGCMKK